MEITVSIVYQFGNERIFPVCNTSILLSKLIAQKSFTRRDLTIIKELGYTIKIKQQEVIL